MATRIKTAFITLLISFSSFSQDLVCGTEVTPREIDALSRLRVRPTSDLRTDSPTRIAITAHVARRSDGTGGLTASELNEAMADVNAIYTLTNMEFFLFGDINYIDDDQYFNFSSSQETELASKHFVENTINVYFFNSATSGSSQVCGYARFPASGIDRIVMVNSCTTNGSTFPHELGHYFALYHTHGKTNSGTTDEFVNGTNCETAGDDICDTAADPNLSGKVDASCNYTGTDADSNGDTFVPNPRNLMSYSQKQCRDEFSQGQADRIVAAYLEYKTYLRSENYGAFFEQSRTEICENDAIQFIDKSVNAVSYEWTFEGGTPATSSEASPSVVYEVPGEYDVSLVITEAGGGTDTRFSENLISVKGNVTTDLTSNAGSFEEVGIAEPIYNDDNSFTWTQTGSAASEGSSSMFMNFYSYSTVGAEDYLVFATLNTSEVKVFDLTFDYAYAPYDDSFFDGLEVVYRDPCSDWQSAWFKEGADLSTTDRNQTNSFTPSGEEQWKTETVQFVIDESTDIVEFAFKGINGWGNNLYVDNYSISVFDAEFSISDVLISNASCPDTEDGSIEVSVSKPGTYNYSVDGENFVESNIIENLSPGVYTVTARNFVGNLETTEVTVGFENEYPDAPVISLDGDQFSISILEGQEVQWYYNDAAISGANTAELAYDGGTGSYTVSVSNGSCATFSEPFVILSVDAVETDLVLYPNPARDHINISLKEGLRKDVNQITINDLTGKQIRAVDFTTKIDVSNLESGLYILHFEVDGEKVKRRFLKQ